VASKSLRYIAAMCRWRGCELLSLLQMRVSWGNGCRIQEAFLEGVVSLTWIYVGNLYNAELDISRFNIEFGERGLPELAAY
jgi:hypothetical protein